MLIDIRNASSPVASPRVRSRVRWGRRLAATAWKSSSGARATISTLKMNPAAAASTAARTNSAPELTSTCSESIISSTAAAKAPPRASVNSSPASVGPSRWDVGWRRWRAIANGSTVMLASGATAIPSATASTPSAIPTATATGNISREPPSSTSRVA